MDLEAKSKLPSWQTDARRDGAKGARFFPISTLRLNQKIARAGSDLHRQIRTTSAAKDTQFAKRKCSHPGATRHNQITPAFFEMGEVSTTY